ncbi:MAG TPA: thrombospondin type 3 repeat-containing protein, partial [Verrucomicrobiae bacterium]|nr:thrombospondin type 3 repeat-containing protein [Verrucomicrobiae bacterium]
RTLYNGDPILEQSGGGVLCASSSAVVSNCVIEGNSCFTFGAGAYSGTLLNCQVVGNTNRNTSMGGGGGVAESTLLNCQVSGNYLQNVGGGAYSSYLSNCIVSDNTQAGVLACTLDDCIVEGNTNIDDGGGASQSLLNNCLLCNNEALHGGGASESELNNCIVSNNTATWGGGIYEMANPTNRCGTNDQLVANFASYYGGGCLVAGGGILTNWEFNNWSFVSNSAAQGGGGIYFETALSALNDCTFQGNSALGNGGGLSCNGGNLQASGYVYTAATNCTFIGNSATGLGGGAYFATLNNCRLSGNQAGYGGGAYGIINDCTVDNNIATNSGGGLYYHAQSGAPLLVGCAFTNNSAPNGGGAYLGAFSNCIFSANIAVTGGGANSGTFYNSIFSNNSATNGGAAYYAAMMNCLVISNQAGAGGGCSNGRFLTGWTAAYVNCQFIGNSAVTNGGGLFSNGLATNCLIMNNSAGGNGGGIDGGSAVRCRILGNSAVTNGGGVYAASLVNSLVAGNTAAFGGGSCQSSLQSVTLVDNVASSAGGGFYYVAGGSVFSSIIYDNSAPVAANYYSTIATFSYSCTTPLPSSGNNNFTNDPVFVNFATENFRLQTNSPCINTGGGVPGSADLDGRPRIVGGQIDIGAYEFQGAGIGEFTAWLQQYGLPTDGSADYLDSDGDGLNNWDEWIAGTNPTNGASALMLFAPAVTNILDGITVTWQSVTNITYFVDRSSDLSAAPAFSTIESNIAGLPGATSFTDSSATNTGPYFYRVGVQQ